ncbi:MAG: hypothetical protein JXB88_18490 [Spirochaetales bacterium]|nr:hypothetical protein [Spirochaetales bacterium]
MKGKRYYLSHTNSGKRKILKLVLFFFVLIPVMADPALLSILEKSSYTDEQKENICEIFKEAEVKEIPSSLILPRLEEGISKQVPYNRLKDVLVNEIDCLVQARELLIAVDTDIILLKESSIWLRTGILLAKHIPAKTIRAIACASISRWEDYRDATVLYLSLIQWGLTDDKALMAVEFVLQSSITGQDFIGIINIFTRGRSLHISPEEILIRMKEVIDDIDTIETLEEKILY